MAVLPREHSYACAVLGVVGPNSVRRTRGLWQN